MRQPRFLYSRRFSTQPFYAILHFKEEGVGLVWLIILGAVMIALVFGMIYLIACVGRFSIIQKISGGGKWRRRGLSFLILAVVFSILTMTISLMNAIIVFLHLVLFFLLFGLAAQIFERYTGKQSMINRQGWLALGFCAVYLTAAYGFCHHVWKKDYTLQTDKELGTLKIALIADSHLGTTFDGEGFARHLKTIEAQSQNLLMLAGDLVDDEASSEDLLRAG